MSDISPGPRRRRASRKATLNVSGPAEAPALTAPPCWVPTAATTRALADLLAQVAERDTRSAHGTAPPANRGGKH
jgi:hypothetical protein